MMFQTFVTLGIKATEQVTKSDFEQLEPVIQKQIQAQGEIDLLLDMTGFQGQDIDAFSEDLTIGQDLSGKVKKMAIVSDKTS
jgi:hypothetical protein